MNDRPKEIDPSGNPDDQTITNIAEAFKADDERRLRSLYPSLFETSQLRLTAAEENEILEKIRRDFAADDRRRLAGLLPKSEP